MSELQHRRESVLDGVVVALERIVTDTTTGWATGRAPTVKKMTRETLLNPQYPLILVAISSETKTGGASSGGYRTYDATMDVVVQGFTLEDEISEGISRMLHDIEKALALDPSFGGAAIDSAVTGNQTEVTQTGQGPSSVVVSMQVQYGHQDSEPSALR